MKKMLALLSLICCGAASGQSDQEIFDETAVLCVSTLGITSMLTEAELAKMVFERDAKWWRKVLSISVDAVEADNRIMTQMRSLNARWENKAITWDQLLDLAKNCSEMESMAE